MDTGSRILPIPLWLEYSRIKYELQSKLATQSYLTPPVEFCSKTSPQSTFINRSAITDEPIGQGPAVKQRFSISLSPDKSLEEIKTSPCFPSEKSSLAPASLMETNPLKHSIQTLKKSVQDLKRNSQDLYINISRLSSRTSSLRSSPTNARAKVFSKLARFSKTPSTNVLQNRSDFSRTATFTDEKSVQAEPPPHTLTPNETLECVGKLLSFSQLAESKKEATTTNTPSVPEADLSEAENRPSEVVDYDSSPRSVPKSMLGAESTSGSRTISPSRARHLAFVKPAKDRSPTGSLIPRSNTVSESSLTSSAPEVSKVPMFFMKAVNVNGRYFSNDAVSMELILGKQTNQGIVLKGKETEGGFRVFFNAQDAMNQVTPLSPKKGGRICLMKVRASGPSLR